MRALIQRVSKACVVINDSTHDSIGKGILILLGVCSDDDRDDSGLLAQRCALLRIFEDEGGKMNLSLKDTGGEALVVSQFTLYADTRKGHRPSFIQAARPDAARTMYDSFIDALGVEIGREFVHSGLFGAMMDVHLTNSGPVTVLLESK